MLLLEQKLQNESVAAMQSRERSVAELHFDVQVLRPGLFRNRSLVIIHRTTMIDCAYLNVHNLHRCTS